MRLAVYGSCVSRDTVELLDPERFALVRYVARQSVISAFAPHAELDVSGLDSPFQARMLAGDAAGDVVERLAEVDPEMILWDLADERLGVLRSPEGAVVTRSIELLRSGHEEELRETWELVEFGTDEHFALWCAGVDAFLAAMREAGLLERLVLVQVPWATRSTTRAKVPSNFGVEPALANARYRRYYRHLRRLRSWPRVTLASLATRSDPDHRWGHAPFHYDAGTYRRMCRQIEARAAELR